MSSSISKIINKSLNNYNKNQTICAVIIICFIVIIPRYIELPKNIKLLFNDRIGQILLLLLAIFIGSYNFVCGVLLIILFLSIMLNSQNITEGFESGEIEIQSEPFEDDEEDKEQFEDDEENKEQFEDDEEDKEEFEDEDMKLKSEYFEDGEEEDKADKVANYQEQIKKLESKIDKLENTPAPTASKKTTKKVSAEDEMLQENKRKKEMADVEEEVTTKPTKNTPKVTKSNSKPTDESFMNAEEELIENFNCGCDTNDRRSKLINYARADQVDPSLKGFFETFDNPGTPEPSRTPGPSATHGPTHPKVTGRPSPTNRYENFTNSKTSSKVINTPNPYDISGCRYDLKEDNPLHETIYGAPVSSCQAYTKANVAGSGTVFYPLNAF
jgi:hypothetical protein